MGDRRAAVLWELHRHRPADAGESAALHRMVAFARARPDPFDKADAAGHFTGSGLIVSPDLDRVLLIHHAKLDMWLQCGGHAENGDATCLATALREAQEETGLTGVDLHPAWPRLLDVDIHPIPALNGMAPHEHLDLRYLLVADPEEPISFDGNEAHDARWLGWDELDALELDDGVLRMLAKIGELKSSAQRIA